MVWDEIRYEGDISLGWGNMILPEDRDYEVEIIGTWNMTIIPAGVRRGATWIDLPGKQYVALRVRRV